MSSSTPIHRVAVRVESPYDVVIGEGVLSGLGQAARTACPTAKKAMLAFDLGLRETTVNIARQSLRDAGFTPAEHGLIASEEHKSIERFERLLAAMTDAKLERGEPVVALGGGVVGDLAGFAAASYRRGVPFIQCPTTLLSMVDASVGGKTGVNIRSTGGILRKNMVGAFHQPRCVLADVATLRSLPPRHFRAGLAECVKHALLAGPLGMGDLLAFLRLNAAPLAAGMASLLAELVARNVAIKAKVVESDPREESSDDVGGRALLNLGHTFGHAFEPVPSARGVLADGTELPAPLHHGEAVALGMLSATIAANELGLSPTISYPELTSLLTTLGLPVRARGLPDSSELLATMSHDKKATGGRMRLILPTRDHACRVVADPPQQAILAGIDGILTR